MPAAARVRLFCLASAGGSAAVYRTWKRHLPPAIDVEPLELPGRGLRWQEPPRRRVAILVDELAEEVQRRPAGEFALFGHSLGGLLAFELARRLRRTGAPAPAALLVFAARAPHLAPRPGQLHTLDDDALIESLRGFKGTPPELLGNREIMALLLPAVRADFELIETYRYAAEAPLACPIVAFGGVGDRFVLPLHLEPWRAQTDGAFALAMTPGDHFYPNTHPSQFLRLLVEQLAHVAGAPAAAAAPRRPAGDAAEPSSV